MNGSKDGSVRKKGVNHAQVKYQLASMEREPATQAIVYGEFLALENVFFSPLVNGARTAKFLGVAQNLPAFSFSFFYDNAS